MAYNDPQETLVKQHFHALFSSIFFFLPEFHFNLYNEE